MKKIDRELRKRLVSYLKDRNYIEFFEELGFSVYCYKDQETDTGIWREYEVEIWTDGGVDMIFSFRGETLSGFVEEVENFDVDDEIELHRQGEQYKKAFTLRESLDDFEGFKKWLDKIVSIIQRHDSKN